MALKLGGELELKGVNLKNSTVKGRNIFLKLLEKMKPNVSIDLMRLFNLNCLPKKHRENLKVIHFFTRFFLLHSNQQILFDFDYSKIKVDTNIKNTPLLSFFDFLHKNQAELLELASVSKKEWKEFTDFPKPKLIKETALEKLIPNWKALESRKDSKLLCSTLKEWASRWNLTDDWCLDFALSCLRICKIEIIDNLHFSENYLIKSGLGDSWTFIKYHENNSAWKQSIWQAKFTDGIRGYDQIAKIENYPQFYYKWEPPKKEKEGETFEITDYYYPLTSLANFFRQRVESKFWSKFFKMFRFRQHLLIGENKTITTGIKDFQKKVEIYIKKVEKKHEDYSEKTPTKRDNTKHFKLLIDYQIPPVKNYSQLGRNQNEKKTMKRAIQSVSKLIGLTLRNPSRGGRPKGSGDSKPRSRT